MLVANITDKAKMLAAEGSLLTLTADVCMVIAGVYQKLEGPDGSNKKREMFRKALIGFLTDEDSALFVPIEQFDNADEGESE